MSDFTRKTAPDATGGRYTTEMFTYPDDLFGNGAAKYGNSWMMININVMADSAAGGKGGYQTIDLDAAERNAKLKSNIQSIGLDSKIAAASVTTAAAGAGLLSSFLSGKSLVEAGIATAQGAVAGGIASLPFLSSGTASRETKRLAIAIQMPMPNSLSSNYNMAWSDDNTKIFDMIMRAGAGVEKAIANKSLEGVSSEVADAAVSASLGAQSFLGAGAVSAATGLASNPKKESVFEGVNFRQFRIDHKFYPRSSLEAFKVWNIIKTLKYHMHPEYKSSGKFTFVYPSEFDITFYGAGGEENPWVGRIATCVLTDLTVNYTPEALWAAHADGFPNSIMISMNFKELSILTKSEIEDKGY